MTADQLLATVPKTTMAKIIVASAAGDEAHGVNFVVVHSAHNTEGMYNCQTQKLTRNRRPWRDQGLHRGFAREFPV